MENKELHIAIMRFCSQTEAAAFAVLTEHIANRINEDILGTPLSQDELTVLMQARETLFSMRDSALKSIDKNDGRIVEHIGTAAKQMNPLLS